MIKIEEVQSVLGYEFRDKLLLIQAFGFPSKSFERLEFLGDRVVNLCVAERFFKTLPQASEGELHRNVSKKISNDFLALLGQRWKLGEHLAIEDPDDYLLACTVEAVLGAVYMDSGGNFFLARGVFGRLFLAEPSLGEPIEAAIAKARHPAQPKPKKKHKKVVEFYSDVQPLNQLENDPRMRIKKWAWENLRTYPHYAKRQEMNGNGQVIVELLVLEVVLGIGQGKNISTSSRGAAQNALISTKNLTDFPPKLSEKIAEISIEPESAETS